MSVADLLRELKQRKGRFFGLVTPVGAREGDASEEIFESLCDARTHTGDAVLLLRARPEGLELERARRGDESLATGGTWSHDGAKLALPGLLPAIVLVAGFDQLTLVQQMGWFGVLREIREKSRVPLQLIAVGPWRPEAFLVMWRQVRHHVSAPLERHNVYWHPSLGAPEIRAKLSSLIDAQLAHLDVLAELVCEHTGGDAELVATLLEALHSRSRPEDVERAVFTLPQRSLVLDLVLSRVADIGATARRKLAACLQFGGLLESPDDDLDCEFLASRGLLRRPTTVRNQWRVSSPTVAAVLRAQARPLQLDMGSLPPPDELLPTRHPIASKLNALVCEVENLLRNLVITELSSASDVNHPLQAAPRRGGEDFYARATEGRDQDADAPHIHLLLNPLSAQLEVSHLKSIILHADLYSSHFAKYFPDQTAFTAKFDEFNGLRRLAAHNKVASVRSLTQLSELRGYFEKALARVARDEARREPAEELVRVHTEAARQVKVDGKKEIVISLEAENLSSSRLYGVCIEVTVATVHGEAPVTVHARDLAFRVGERRTLTVSTKGDALHFTSETEIRAIRVVAARRDS